MGDQRIKEEKGKNYFFQGIAFGHPLDELVVGVPLVRLWSYSETKIPIWVSVWREFLQLICDPVVAWGASVTLTFNGLKSVLMIFSSKRNLPMLSLLIDSVPVHRSNSCLFLGLTIEIKHVLGPIT